jgi:hypothetical protein
VRFAGELVDGVFTILTVFLDLFVDGEVVLTCLFEVGIDEQNIEMLVTVKFIIMVKMQKIEILKLILNN